MTAFYLGPMGSLRPLDLVQRGAGAQASRASSSWTTLGGRRVVQRAPRAPRSWALDLGQRRDVARLAHLAACASGAIPGPVFLYTADAAATNLLPADVAAPGVLGTAALGASLGTVGVGMLSGLEQAVAAAQGAAQGAWSQTVPLRGVTPLTLSAWASAAGAAIAWRTVTAAGVQVATGTVTAAAAGGGFRGQASITPGATAAGLQVALSAGSGRVGGLRLTEGAHDAVWVPGRGVPQVVVSDPTESLQLVADGVVLADYQVTIEEVG